MKLWVLRWSPFLQFFQEYIDIENNWLLLLFCSWILNIEKVLTSLKKFSRNSICKKKFFFFLALPNIIPLLFYSNHTTNDIFIILYYNVGIFWQIAAVTYTIGPYWILDDLIIIYYLSSSQSILCVLPKLLSAAIIKMAWQNDCKKSSSTPDIFASHLSDLKNRTRKFNGVSSSVLLRLLLPFAAAAPSCVLTPPRSIIESPTASKIPPPVSWKVSCSTFRSSIPRDKEAELCGSTSAP